MYELFLFFVPPVLPLVQPRLPILTPPSLPATRRNIFFTMSNRFFFLNLLTPSNEGLHQSASLLQQLLACLLDLMHTFRISIFRFLCGLLRYISSSSDTSSHSFFHFVCAQDFIFHLLTQILPCNVHVMLRERPPLSFSLLIDQSVPLRNVLLFIIVFTLPHVCLRSCPANFFFRFGCRNTTLDIVYLLMQPFHFFPVLSFHLQCIEEEGLLRHLGSPRRLSVSAESRCTHLLSCSACFPPHQCSFPCLPLILGAWVPSLAL